MKPTMKLTQRSREQRLAALMRLSKTSARKPKAA
jgi:hypothetical protein